ncbi:MAG: LLM class flavin-dependent oxidoreductase [Alphaproteobacteria bacterium]|jgi:F420-dependent oxidoreductase-like protein|nr:LLM class flavin-dependent oxidoreductase [Alphaproteobacteria bacterium]MDP6567616.1 LLM class flavin-dependent oxidoreductase [Alphaproteobacteria bacterium]MDP6812556.1 LLM class flavin-dependent oxidoreductase [Alphaproteobacteria bacterium]
MKISISIGGYAGVDTAGTVDFVRQAEKLGVDCVWTAEAWGQDAVTALAYLAPQTSRIKLGTGIMQISARVPSMTAMTALSLNALSGGRFVLGLGASGPQVVEGLHGVDYTAPLSRLKETVDIVRLAFKGEKLAYQGRYHELPRPGGEGKALRLDHKPADIPIFLATLGPKSLEYTGAAADGWLGTSFSPDHAEAHLAYLRQGAEGVGRTLDDIELHATCSIGIGDNVEELIDARRPGVAFSMGAMGSATTNFYNDAFQRAGFADDARAIQQLWLAGKRREAAARVPDEMITRFGAIGTPEMVRERFRRYRQAGIDSLTLRLDGDTAARIAVLEQVMDLLRDLD